MGDTMPRARARHWPLSRPAQGGREAGESVTEHDARHILLRLFQAAVDASDPVAAVRPFLPDRASVVVGAGKAALGMAKAVVEAMPEVGGVVVVPHCFLAPRQVGRISVLTASHPVPDASSLEAARQVMAAVQALGADDLVLCLLSGGGSSLLALPPSGVTLEEKQAVTRALLASGATIQEMNCVRRHLSAIKGGRLAKAAEPAQVLTLAISDVPGDDPVTIASGPTVQDPTTVQDAMDVLRRYGICAPEQAMTEAPPVTNSEYRVVACAATALQAAARLARAEGFETIILSDRLGGEAREVGRRLAQMALSLRPKRPTVILSGGETEVTVRGNGRGGRNTELALAAALELLGAPGVFVLSADTDGVDGNSGGAGAFAGPSTLSRARAAGLDGLASLANNDSGGFFDAISDLIVTGPTGTNVSDFRAFLVCPS